MKSGLCSVTFREKTPKEVIALAQDAQLKGIEWGTDKHVPVMDIQNASEVGKLTRDAGLEVAGLGSYWTAFDKYDQPNDFRPIIATAIALGAPVIRIWAGSLVIDKTAKYFSNLVLASKSFAEAAAKEDIKVAYEYHRKTFTETLPDALKLLSAVNHPNQYIYWQPIAGTSIGQRLEEIKAIKDRLLNVHIFHWIPDGNDNFTRLTLREGESLWKPALQLLGTDPKRFALLEFVKNNSLRQFVQDSAILNKWLKEIKPNPLNQEILENDRK